MQAGFKIHWEDGSKSPGKRVLTQSPVSTARIIGALNKDIVVRVARHTDPAGGRNQMAMIFDEPEQLKPQAFPDGQFRTGQHIRIFFENGRGNVETRWLGDR
jgi:hypothetical protein